MSILLELVGFSRTSQSFFWQVARPFTYIFQDAYLATVTAVLGLDGLGV